MTGQLNPYEIGVAAVAQWIQRIQAVGGTLDIDIPPSANPEIHCQVRWGDRVFEADAYGMHRLNECLESCWSDLSDYIGGEALQSARRAVETATQHLMNVEHTHSKLLTL